MTKQTGSDDGEGAKKRMGKTMDQMAAERRGAMADPVAMKTGQDPTYVQPTVPPPAPSRWVRPTEAELAESAKRWDAADEEHMRLHPPTAVQEAEDETAIVLFSAWLEADFILKGGDLEEEKKRIANLRNDPRVYL